MKETFDSKPNIDFFGTGFENNEKSVDNLMADKELAELEKEFDQ